MKTINKKPVFLTLLLALASVMFSCVDDEFDTPPATTIPVGETITIQEIKNLFNNENDDYLFTTDRSVFAVVTMDDKSGNIYKTAYIQDQTGAIALHLDASGGLYQGDSIRIQLNGLKVGQYSKLFQIDASDGNGFTMDNYITKLETKVEKTPKDATILDIISNMSYYQCRIVKLNNIQFIASDTSKTYADGENLVTENRTIEDENGRKLIVRTSGYAAFANEPIPNGSGSLIAIIGQYNNDIQLYLRSTEEVIMENERFDGSGGGGDGSGTFENPYNVAAGIVNQDESEKWIEGYLVGVYETKDELGNDLSEFAPSFTAPFYTNTNVIIADNDDETNILNCLVIQIPSGDIRNNVNLVDNSANLGKSIKFKGNLESYFSTAGLKSVNGYWMDGDGINPEDPAAVEILGTSTTVSTLNENFNSATANTNFAENGWLNANKEGERYWQGKEYNSNKYTQSTAYGATSENIEMWMVSPGVELTTPKKLNFDSNAGYYRHDGLTVWVSTDFNGDKTNLFSSTWTEITDVTIATSPTDGYGDWTNSGDIDLSSYSGTIYILFKYVGDNENNTTTFQVDNVQLTDL